MKACASVLTFPHAEKLAQKGDGKTLANFPEIPLTLFDVILPESSADCTHVECMPEVTREDGDNTFHFEPLTPEIQVIICHLLGLQLVCFLYREAPAPRRARIRATPITLPVSGDGNCFFRAVSVLLTGSEAQHVTLRQVICDYIARNHTDLYAHADYLTTYYKYAQRWSMGYREGLGARKA
jgi:hypothetical protein